MGSEYCGGLAEPRAVQDLDNLDAVLADSNVDAVLLATPHSLHPAQVMACAAARKDVFCEKPLALHQADAARMFEASRKAGVTLAVGHNRRFWPAMNALRNVVASGKLGTMLHIEGHNSNENSNSVLSGWRLSPEESPGGGLTGAGLHILDAFVSMLGPVRRVYAQVNSHRQGPPPLDTAIVMLDFANGVTGTLATVRATPFLLARSRLRNEGLCELDAFVDAIEGKRSFPVPEAEVLATLSAFEAALQSIASGNPVGCGDS